MNCFQFTVGDPAASRSQDQISELESFAARVGVFCTATQTGRRQNQAPSFNFNADRTQTESKPPASKVDGMFTESKNSFGFWPGPTFTGGLQNRKTPAAPDRE
jgi:hypothetical protein